MQSRVTMQDIADALGIGKASVSRAFRNHPKCGLALREKILAKAEELGYRPDPLQRIHMAQLRGGRPEDAEGTVIAYLVTNCQTKSVEDCLTNGRFIEGARQRTRELGLGMEIFRPLDAGLSMDRFRRVLMTRGIHGVIIGPMPVAHSTLDLNLEGIAGIAIAHSLESPDLHRVGHNHYQATWDAMEKLYARGRRRFGLAIEERLMARVGHRWNAAYQEFCRIHEDTEPLPQLILDDPSLGSAATPEMEVHRWVQANAIDTVMGLWPGLIPILKSGGWRVPEEVLYFDLDNFPGKSAETFPGIDQDYQGIGAAAVDELVAQWVRQEYGVPRRSKTILLGWNRDYGL